MVSFTSLHHLVQHDPDSSASPGSLSAGTSTTLSMYCSWCASAVFWTVCGVDTCFCTATSSSSSGVQAPPPSQRNGCSRSCQMSCTCGTLTVFFRVLKLVLIAVVGDMDQIVCFFVVMTSRRCVLSCLAAKLLIWTLFAAEASGCFCREFVVALDLPCSQPLWVRSSHPLWVRSCHSGARQSCWVFSLFSTSRWQTVRLLRVVCLPAVSFNSSPHVQSFTSTF